jgi:transcriptional/translational regulatory protein YebC/TACO1
MLALRSSLGIFHPAFLARGLAGHSHYANVKHKKARSAAARSQAFSRAARAVRMAVRLGGGADPGMNSLLAEAIHRARAVNVPRANIEAAVRAGAGEHRSGGAVERVSHEVVGRAGAGFVVEQTTDNRLRAADAIKQIVNKDAAVKMAREGVVGHAFERLMTVLVPFPKGEHDEDDDGAGEAAETNPDITVRALGTAVFFFFFFFFFVFFFFFFFFVRC